MAFAFYGRACGCGGAKQIKWKQDLVGPPPPPPPDVPVYLTQFQIVSGVFTLVNSHGAITELGWSQVTPGVTVFGVTNLVKRVTIFNPPLSSNGVTIASQMVDLYRVNTAVAVASAGQPGIDGRFTFENPIGANVGTTIHGPWGFRTYVAPQAAVVGEIFDTPSDGTAGNGVICQIETEGGPLTEPTWYPYFTLRNSMRETDSGGYAGVQARIWNEITEWTYSGHGAGTPGGTIVRSFNATNGTRVCTALTVIQGAGRAGLAGPTPYPAFPTVNRGTTIFSGDAFFTGYEVTPLRQVYSFSRMETTGQFSPPSVVSFNQIVELIEED